MTRVRVWLVAYPDYVKMWRTKGAYGTPTEGMTAQEVATPAFARAIGLIACDIADYAADFVQRRIAEQTDADDVHRWALRVSQGLRERDIATGEPTGTAQISGLSAPRGLPATN